MSEIIDLYSCFLPRQEGVLVKDMINDTKGHPNLSNTDTFPKNNFLLKPRDKENSVIWTPFFSFGVRIRGVSGCY